MAHRELQGRFQLAEQQVSNSTTALSLSFIGPIYSRPRVYDGNMLLYVLYVLVLAKSFEFLLSGSFSPRALYSCSSWVYADRLPLCCCGACTCATRCRPHWCCAVSRYESACVFS